MLIKAQDSALVVIDMQERLISAVVAPDRSLKNTHLVRQVAARTIVPSLSTEQYPEGLGTTVPPIVNTANRLPVLPKLYFSCL